MAVRKYSKPLYKLDDYPAPSCSGSPTEPEYTLDYPVTGGVALKQIGVKQTYKIIQSNLENCNISQVIDSCVRNKEYCIVNEDTLTTHIADFTSLSNLGDLYAGTKRIEHTWKELPLEVRQKFDGDIKKFIRSIGSDDFQKSVSDGFNSFYNSIKKPNPKVPLVSSEPAPEPNAPDPNQNVHKKNVSNVDVKGDE